MHNTEAKIMTLCISSFEGDERILRHPASRSKHLFGHTLKEVKKVVVRAKLEDEEGNWSRETCNQDCVEAKDCLGVIVVSSDQQSFVHLSKVANKVSQFFIY